MVPHRRRSRLLIIGLDGATFRVLDPLLEEGVLPHLRGIMERGVRGVLRSTIPTNSASAWVSFMTGKNPGKHGVFEFQVRTNPGGQRTISSSRSIHGETLWQILSRRGLRVVAMNIPMTYPPQPVNGALVSGIPVPGSSRSWAYPESLADELDRAVDGYIISIPWRDVFGRVKPFLEQLTTMTRKRARAARFLMERYEPDVMAVVFVGPDRLQHCLWQFLDENHARYREREAREHRGAIQNYFFELDQAVGELLADTDKETTVIVLSDHGFQAAEKQLSLNEWLAEEGLLRFPRAGLWSLIEPLRQMENPLIWRLRNWWRDNASRRLLSLAPKPGIDWPRTTAYAPWGFQQGVSVNLAGREAHGTVEPGAAYEELRNRLQTKLMALRDPESGRPVVREVRLREDCYSGPFLDLAADVVLTPEEGFSVSPPPRRHMLFRSTGWASGCHERDGVLLVAGKGIRQGRFAPGPALQDVVPTVLHLLGLPIPDDMDGRVLDELYSLEANAGAPEYEATSESAGVEMPDIFTEEESRDLQKKLRGLGYLG
jgi:predicted AlkP superfamily phosphohydrolase/phosphomutase